MTQTPFQDVFAPNPDQFSEEALQAADAQLAAIEESQQIQKQINEQEQIKAREEATAQLKKQEPTKTKGSANPLESVASSTAKFGELVSAIPAGVADFASDITRAFPEPEWMKDHAKTVRARNYGDGLSSFPTLVGDDGYLKKLPKHHSKLAQALRELSSIVLPTIFLTKGLNAAGASRHAANLASTSKAAQRLAAVGNDPLVRMISTTGLAAGSGAFVDATNVLNQTDDNLQGSLKKMFPSTFSWIPDNWATLPTDSPEVHRAKNVNEGVGLGIFSDMFVGTLKLVRAWKGTKDFTSYIPENETAKAFFDNPTSSAAKKAANVADKKARKEALTDLAAAENGKELLASIEEQVEEVVESSAKNREEALEELGKFLDYNKNADDLDKPLLGVHDVFDYEESGTRGVDDMGIIGATVDAARIQGNSGTVYGRLRSIVTEAALKYGLNAALVTRRQIINTIKETIQTAGKYSYLDGVTKLSFKQIDEAGSRLAQVLLDPRMDVDELKLMLSQFKQVTEGIKNVRSDAYNAVVKAIKGYLDEFVSMDSLKARAYLSTSLAGQISDMAEGARHMDETSAVERAQEQILDRVEYLLVEKGLASYVRGASLNFLNTWQRLKYINDPKKAQEVANAARESTEDSLGNILKRSKSYRETIQAINKERPEFLKPLILANELTDGNVDSIYKLNEWVRNSLGTVSKAFLDGKPQIPSQIMQGVWANIYNSVLSSITTPLKAGFGNAAKLLGKPMNVLAGAAITRDMPTFRRAWFQYSALGDTMVKGLGHMARVFQKVSTDPHSVSYVVREDVAIKNAETLEVLRSFADAASSKGNYGPEVMVNLVETLNDLALHPVLRFSTNAMTALDGFTKAVVANAEARGRAWDEMFGDGLQEIDANAMRKAADDHYNKLFDSQGMISDEAVEYASREITLNLDNPAVDAMSSLLREVPALKPFIMFPRTSVNILGDQWQNSALSAFAGDYRNFIGFPGKTFSADEIRSLLESKGIPIDQGDVLQRFATMQAEIRGRVAIGTLMVGAGAYWFANDSLRGDGHYNKTRQQVREDMDWKKRTIKGLDGKWYTYDGLGPLSDWLALTATVMDNFDLLSVSAFEDMQRKLGFILGATFTNKSMLAGLEPMNDVLSGNPAAINRWTSSFASGLAPLSGLRANIGRIMYPMLRELNQEFLELVRNRNAYLDVFDPDGRLPMKYDWVDGELVGYPESFMARIVNGVSPIKVYDEVSPERQFLIDIEFDSRPSFATATNGVEYTPKERSELFNIIGQQGFFRNQLKEIMADAKAIKFVEKMKAARRKGIPSTEVDVNKFAYIYNRIELALSQAKRSAESQLSTIADVEQRVYDKQQREFNVERGILDIYK